MERLGAWVPRMDTEEEVEEEAGVVEREGLEKRRRPMPEGERALGNEDEDEDSEVVEEVQEMRSSRMERWVVPMG